MTPLVYGDVIEHLSDPLRIMRELNRHLAPGAVVIVSVPNVAHLSVRLSLLFGRFEYQDRGILDRTHLRSSRAGPSSTSSAGPG